jgi:hypothetical protein
MTGPQRLGEAAAETFTGIPERNRAVLLTTTRAPFWRPEISS